MRRLFTLLLASLSFYTWARQITPEEAMTAASDFMNSSELSTAESANIALRPMKAPGLDVNAGATPYYIFNRGEKEGFVIISGDDRVQKILGYSDKGSFDAENIPPQLKDLMESWTKQINSMTGEFSHATWTATASTRAAEGVLMETAEWGQGYPYNAMCPIIDGVQAPAGCVATAMAITMKYHNWPDYTRGDIQSDYYNQELTFDFSNYTIDWEVLDDLNNPKFAQEVSKLTFSAGVCSSMLYGSQESSAYVWPVGNKMIELYTYAKGCQFIGKEFYSDEEWENILKLQLENVGPVIYSGTGYVGHCFIIDGYNSSGQYHINWGWDGLLNGYFSLGLTDEDGPYFPSNQAMIIDLKPDKERKVYSKAFIPNVKQYESQEWNFFYPDIKPGERNIVLIPTMTENCFNGYYGLGVVDGEDRISEVFYITKPSAGIRYNCPYPGIYFGNTNQGDNGILFPKLKDGERYQLITMDADYDTQGYENPGFWKWTPPSNDPKNWKIVLGGIAYPSYFYEKGNKSEVSEVTIHVDEKLPFYMEAYKKYATSEPLKFKQLKWENFADNLHLPKKGYSIEMKGYDKEGESHDLLINADEVDGTSNVYSFNLTMNQDFFDIYIKYEPDNDTRKASDLSSSEVFEEKGIVYRIDDQEAKIIGYDNVSESIIIPDKVTTPKGELFVRSVESDAFLHAPVKEITFVGSSIYLDDFSFAGIDKLESVSFDNENSYPSFKWGMPFIKSPYNNIFYNRCPNKYEIQNLLGLQCWSADYDYWDHDKPHDSAVADHKDVNIYISNTMQNPENDFYEFIQLLDYVKEIKEVYHLDDVISAVAIPGIGENSIAKSKYLEYYVPVKEMWKYKPENGFIYISDIMENVSINKIIINDVAIEYNNEGLYEIPASSSDMIDVIVDYSINSSKNLSTRYSSYYNSSLISSELGVETIFSVSENMDVFDMNGILIKKDCDSDSLRGLMPGIYLIRQGNQVRKVVIR